MAHWQFNFFFNVDWHLWGGITNVHLIPGGKFTDTVLNWTCACVQRARQGEEMGPSTFYWQPCHKHESVAVVLWNEESLTRVAYIFKPHIGIASKVVPPNALPFSCCTATSVSGPSSLEERYCDGPAVTPEPNWGPRMPPSAATAVLPLADDRIKTPWLARGQGSPDCCSVCRARGRLCCDGQRIRQCCPAVCMNSDRPPQLLSLSLFLKVKHNNTKYQIPNKWYWWIDDV